MTPPQPIAELLGNADSIWPDYEAPLDDHELTDEEAAKLAEVLIPAASNVLPMRQSLREAMGIDPAVEIAHPGHTLGCFVFYGLLVAGVAAMIYGMGRPW